LRPCSPRSRALLDERSSHLDPRYQVTLLSRLQARFTAADRAIPMVLHDINLAQRFSDHLLVLFGDGGWMGGLMGTRRPDTLSRA